MADTANKARLSADPYNAIYGSPLQQQKVAAMFPGGVPKFDQIYDFERAMAKTRNETLGGSPTAARLSADQLFDSPAGQVLDTAIQLKTGGGISPRAIMGIGTKLADNWRVRFSQQRANELAPLLFNTDTSSIVDYLTQLEPRLVAQQARQAAYSRNGALAGALALPQMFLGGGQ
jgi:hypothetical protein